VTGGLRKWRHEKLHDLPSSQNSIRLIKKRRTKWMGHGAGMGDRRGAYRILVGRLGERKHFEDPGVNGRVISKYISQDGIRRSELDLSGTG
jgi:hypothetical protein